MNVTLPLSLTIPDELIEEIMLKLPVKSLIRFKCLSKSFLFIISDPQFAKSHFNLSAAPTYRLLNFNKDYELNAIDIDAPLHDDSAQVVFNSLHPSCLPNRGRMVQIVGSCRGFILLQIKQFNEINFSLNLASFVIWNPSTGLHKQIMYNELMHHSRRLCGIGYDSSIDDYVVALVTTQSQNTMRIQCFSFRKKSWKVYEHNVVYYYPICSLNGEFLNGALHWLVGSYDNLNIVILALNVKENTLLEIALPYDLTSGLELERYFLYPLGVIGECLCLCFMNRETRMLETWTMKDYNVPSSWTKSFVLSRHLNTLSVFYPICFTANGQILGTDGDGMLAKFNDKGEFLEHRIYEKHGIKDLLYNGFYKETLLSLPEDIERGE
ncbi:hypothetical protein VNO78_13104 [Psophocarpus tetragonolobus]|uniref:F-box domain-containing protein n=1 Tax=Psophocarpus tetragonolobus TaxID=3891 RepID=A0AAN9XPD4_PSOTE